MLLPVVVGTRALAAVNYRITYNTSSTLTGEKGVACINCLAAGAFAAGWEAAGKPSKVKVIGQMEGFASNWEMCRTITYLDLSEATMVDQYTGVVTNTLEKEHLAYLSSQESDDECALETLVLPDGLTSFRFWNLGRYDGPTFFPLHDIYTNNPAPFYVDCGSNVNTYFHVPEGSKTAWQQSTSLHSQMAICDTPVKTVTSTQGNLAGQLTAQEIETVDVLIVNGEINAKDFAFLGQMKELNRLVINAAIKSYYGSDGPTPSMMVYANNLIPAYSFANNTSLREVRLPSDYHVSIGDYAFDGCTNLTFFGYRSDSRYGGSYGGVFDRVGDFAFRNTKITSVMLKSNIATIGKNPFFGTPTMYTVERYSHYDYDYNEGETHYELDNFSISESGSYYESQLVMSKDSRILYASHWPRSSEKLSLPSTVVEVKDYALSDIQAKEVALNSTLRTIGDAFLYRCKNLNAITGTGTYYTAEDGVMYSADKKRLVKYPCAKADEAFTIPASVEQIDKWAFEGAGNLTSLTVEAVTPPTVGELVFEDVDLSQITLYVPKGSKQTYETSDAWSGFKKIVAIGSEAEPDYKLLYINDISACHGAQIEIPVQLDNDMTIAGFQFDVTLPEGVQYVKYEKTERMNGYSVSYNQLSANQLRFLVTSLEEREIGNGTGAVMNLTISIPENQSMGDYTITLSGIELNHNEGSNVETIYQADAISKLTVVAAKPGDANGDGKVSVTDVTTVVNYILQKVPSNFVFEAADVSGDGKVSITDVTKIINIVLGKTGSGTVTRGAMREPDNEIEPE